MEEIDLKELFNMFWSKKLLIIVFVVLFAGIGLVYSKYFVKPEYKAKSTLVLTKNTSNNETITQTEVTLNQKLVATYTEVIRSSGVLRQVISNLGTDITEEELRSSVIVKLVSTTQMIEISVTNSNPEMAKNLTNEITKVFVEKVKDIYKIDNINVVDEAKVPEAPYNINHKKNVLIFAVIGFIVSCAYIFVSSLFDTTIKTAEEAEKCLNLNALASIPNYNLDTKKKNEEELITHKDPKSPISEVFRTLRTNLQFMTSNKGLKTLLITSSIPGEGKSWVSSNLIIAFAKEGKKVLIVDSDMRKGRLHTIFEVSKTPGLSNYLSGVIDVEDKDNILNYIKETKIENVFVMPTGDVPPNPSELLISERTSKLIDELKSMFDVIIFDGTPSLIVTDALILARQVDATLIVTAYKTSKMGDVEKIKKSIENVGGKIAGIVINKISISAKKYENSYYYGNKETKKSDNKVAEELMPEKEEDIIEEANSEVEQVNAEIKKEIENLEENTEEKKDE